MQGTLVMLVGLSGLGCHNKGCDVAYAPPTYTSCFAGCGCYADWHPGPRCRRATRAATAAAIAAATAAVWRRLLRGVRSGRRRFRGVLRRQLRGLLWRRLLYRLPSSLWLWPGPVQLLPQEASGLLRRYGLWGPYAPPVFGSALGMSYPPYTDMATPTGAAATATGGPTGTGTPGTTTGAREMRGVRRSSPDR